MEVISEPKVEVNIDELAKLVFDEAIEVIGGLKKLVEYRNLTWLPSLAEAAYVIVMKNEAAMTNQQIAERLGLTEQTVANILRADEKEIEKFIKGETEELDTHKAGALAKVAYKRVKAKGLEEVVHIDSKSAEVVGVLWAYQVLRSIRGLDFPVEKEDLKGKLEGIEVHGKNVEELLEKIEYPVKTPAELLHKLKEAAKE